MGAVCLAAKQPYANAFLGALPPPGAGSLAERLVGTAAERRLRAKTGTETETVALSGVVGDARRAALAFSALANGDVAAGRVVVDAFAILLSRFSGTE